MKISLTPEAEQELIEGARFYAKEGNTDLGRAFIAAFERSAALLEEMPLLGAPWHGSVRRLPLHRFPYSLVYRVRADEVIVLALAHQRRKPGFWRSES